MTGGLKGCRVDGMRTSEERTDNWVSRLSDSPLCRNTGKSKRENSPSIEPFGGCHPKPHCRRWSAIGTPDFRIIGTPVFRFFSSLSLRGRYSCVLPATLIAEPIRKSPAPPFSRDADAVPAIMVGCANGLVLIPEMNNPWVQCIDPLACLYDPHGTNLVRTAYCCARPALNGLTTRCTALWHE